MISMDGEEEIKEYKERHKAGTTPWDLGKPGFNLVDAVTKTPIQPCKTLEIGCGTGHNSIWLAKQGFTVIGIDVSEIALGKARENASKEGVECNFLLINFLKQDVPGALFGFVFDRGCFHSFDSVETRKQFAERVAHNLEKGGLWLSIVGSDEMPADTSGPPRRSKEDVINAVKEYFEILSIDASHFESRVNKPRKAWVCLMKKSGS